MLYADGWVMGEEIHVWKKYTALYQNGSRNKWSEREIERLGVKKG